jgi:hypothetical protein
MDIPIEVLAAAASRGPASADARALRAWPNPLAAEANFNFYENATRNIVHVDARCGGNASP